MKRKNWKILRGPSAKKNQNSETQKSPEKEFKTHHKHFKSEISRLGKIFRDPRFSRYHSISSIPLCCNCRFLLHSTCRFLTFALSTWPVNDRHGSAILSWLFSVNLYHLCYWDDCPIFESPTVQTLDKWLSYVVHLSLSFKWRYSRYDRRSGNCNLSNCKL